MRAAPITAFLIAVLAAAAGCGAEFDTQWMTALSGLRSVVVGGADVKAPAFVTYADARSLMSPREAAMNDLMDFHWAYPFRSVVLADGAMPKRVVYGEDGELDMRLYCKASGRISTSHATLPEPLVASMLDFSCAFTDAPKPPSLGNRFAAKLRAWRKFLFNR